MIKAMQPSKRIDDVKLVGARLTKFEYGLVCDLTHENSYTTLFYLLLTFQKGLTVFNEYYPATKPSIPSLNNLGKIIKCKSCPDSYNNSKPEKYTYTFNDNSWMSIEFYPEENHAVVDSMH